MTSCPIQYRRSVHAGRPTAGVCSIVIVGLFAAIASAAPPTLNYFYPPGVQRGTSVEAAASGSFSNWPVGVWIDRAGLSIECLEEKGKVKLVAAADAAPGVYWVRLHDKEGASGVRPVVVGTLAETIDKEPNDAPSAPQSLDQSSVVNGRLEKGGDVDGFSIALEEGQTLVASLDGNGVLNSPMDAVLQVCSDAGFVLAQNDDAGGVDPLIVFTAPRAGKYIVRTFAFPIQPNSSIAFAGGDTYVYRLTITSGPVVDRAIPMAVTAGESAEVRLGGWNLPAETASRRITADAGARDVRVWLDGAAGFVDVPVVEGPVVVAADANGLDQPQEVSIPCVISGVIESPGDIDAFRFTAAKGAKVRFRVAARSLLFPIDPLLKVLDAEGKAVAEVDDTGKEPDGELTFTAPADGPFSLAVQDLHKRGGERFAYRIAAAEPKPDYAMSVAADAFSLKPGESTEVAITIERRDGFAEPIDVTAEGLPDGVSAESAKSEPTGDSAKSVKLKLTAGDGASSGPIRIVGRSGGESGKSRHADYATTDPRWRLPDIWIAVPMP